MSTNKKLVEFDAYKYEMHQKNFKRYQDALAKLHNEVEQLMERKVKETEYKEGNALKFYYSELESNPNNTMNLTGEAIAGLQRKSVETLKELQRQADKIKVAPPRLEDYSLYAETDAEIERLKVFQNLVKSFQSFIDLEPSTNLKVYDLAKILTQFRCKPKPIDGTIIPTANWLKTGRTYLNR
jgi:hypothetical protein